MTLDHLMHLIIFRRQIILIRYWLTSLKQSILDAIEHLLARKREIRPLFFDPARPMNDEWNISPYFGVLPAENLNGIIWHTIYVHENYTWSITTFVITQF